MNSDKEFLKMVDQIAEKSFCKKKKVGCIITIENQVVSSGCNCLDGYDFSCSTGDCHQGLGNKCLMIIHAEQNAIIEAMKKNIDLSQATLFVNLSPCLSCARLIYSVGIKKVVFAEQYSIYKQSDIDLGLIFLKSLNVKTKQIV